MRLIWSMNSTPGSALVKLASMSLSQSSAAFTSREIRYGGVAGKVSFQGAPSAAARMKASVTSTERLKWLSTPCWRLAAMNASISGWSQRKVAIMAPRRAPVDWMVAHIASHTAMKETGPEAMLPAMQAGKPRGRRVEKSYPTPPPCCMVTAPSCRARKMPGMESSISPMTKQLSSVTRRGVPAPASTRPPGRKRNPSSA